VRTIMTHKRLIHVGDGVPLLVAVITDITAFRTAEAHSRYLAFHDSLSGLPNRAFLNDRIDQALAHLRREPTASCALLYIDLDRFKDVNDTYGHQAGDELIREFAGRLASLVRETDTVARLGGDEFAVLLSNVTREQAVEVAGDFSAALEQLRFSCQGVDYDINASIGIAMIEGGVTSAADVLRHADIACYVAKRRKRGRYHVYSEHDDVDLAVLEDVQLVGDIRHALANDRFRLHYQPIISTAGGAVEFYEVLMRMLGRDDELVLPGALIGAAERNGIMTEIDRWVVARATISGPCMPSAGGCTSRSICRATPSATPNC
jgi:diguanylate cyclase (GGDEF)-like protein